MPLPLLSNPANYRPDTVDLTRDDEARNYWLDCLLNGLHKVHYYYMRFFNFLIFLVYWVNILTKRLKFQTVKKAIESQPQSSDAVERAENFKYLYTQHLTYLKQRPL